MNFKQLQCFLAVVECQSFTKAAAKLGMAQPTLSQQVQRLEQELSVPLFDRVGRSTCVTQYGKAFERRARIILGAVDDALLEIADTKNLLAGELRVGAIKTLYNSFLVPMCCKFREAYPKVKLSLYEFTGPVIEQMVRSGELDLGISVSPVLGPEVEEEVLFDERLVLIAGPSHELAGRNEINISDVADYPMAVFFQGMRTREQLDQIFQEIDFSANIAVEMDGHEGLLQSVANTDLCAIVPQLAANGLNHEIKIIKLADASAVRSVCLIRHSQRYVTKAAVEFYSFARAEAP